MIKYTIEARDRDGNALGSRECELPSNMAEAIKVFGDEKAVLRRCIQHYVVEVQAELRAAARKGEGKGKASKGALKALGL